jgi:hypothetical protein
MRDYFAFTNNRMRNYFAFTNNRMRNYFAFTNNRMRDYLHSRCFRFAERGLQPGCVTITIFKMSND